MPCTSACRHGPTFDTPLSFPDAVQFIEWKSEHAPEDSGEDYDLSGAYLAGALQDAAGHWPDTFKKPNHPTFSWDSQYARCRPARTGYWDGDRFVPPYRAQPVADWPKVKDEPVLLHVVHANARFESDPLRRREEWEAWCAGYWTDFNGGGWVWNGRCGHVTHVAPYPPRPEEEACATSPSH